MSGVSVIIISLLFSLTVQLAFALSLSLMDKSLFDTLAKAGVTSDTIKVLENEMILLLLIK